LKQNIQVKELIPEFPDHIVRWQFGTSGTRSKKPSSKVWIILSAFIFFHAGKK
jgi:hypothetical protein